VPPVEDAGVPQRVADGVGLKIMQRKPALPSSSHLSVKLFQLGVNHAARVPVPALKRLR